MMSSTALTLVVIPALYALIKGWPLRSPQRARVQGFESRGRDPKLSTLNKWRRALEAAGVRLIDADEHDGPGARLRGAKGKR